MILPLSTPSKNLYLLHCLFTVFTSDLRMNSSAPHCQHVPLLNPFSMLRISISILSYIDVNSYPSLIIPNPLIGLPPGTDSRTAPIFLNLILHLRNLFILRSHQSLC